VDAGLDVPHSEEILPDEDRISGKHIAAYAVALSSEPEVYQQRFSKAIKSGARPEKISEHFSAVKDKITSAFENKKGAKKET
jgi:large subunit ribosomal protein L18